MFIAWILNISLSNFSLIRTTKRFFICVTQVIWDSPKSFPYYRIIKIDMFLKICVCFTIKTVPAYTPRLTFSLVLLDGFGFSVGDVLKRSQKEHHVTLLILNWHDVQKTPEQRSWKQRKVLLALLNTIYDKVLNGSMCIRAKPACHSVWVCVLSNSSADSSTY